MRIGTGDVAVGGRSRCVKQQEPLLQPASHLPDGRRRCCCGHWKHSCGWQDASGGRVEGVVVEDQDETWLVENLLLHDTQCHVSRSGLASSSLLSSVVDGTAMLLVTVKSQEFVEV